MHVGYITLYLSKMQTLSRWRKALIPKSSIAPPLSPSTSFSHSSYFHSSPVSFLKWKNEWSSDVRSGQQPSKTYIKYETRQKRASVNKALKDLLYNSGSSTFPFQGERRTWKINNWDASEADDSGSSYKEGRRKSYTRHAGRANKCSPKRVRRKFRQESSRRENLFDDFDEDPGTMFGAKAGSRCYSWFSGSWEEPTFQGSSTGFDWREDSNRARGRRKKWETPSDNESDDESITLGSYYDRMTLGLPPKGPLKIEDIKNAFRLSALKWHPDRHEGPSQVMAQEKFKLCVNAYNSLRGALSPVA